MYSASTVEVDTPRCFTALIQQKLGISKSTVQRVIQEWKSSSQLQLASRSNRPPALNSRDKRRLYRLSDANPYASLRDLAAESGLGVYMFRNSGTGFTSEWSLCKNHKAMRGRRGQRCMNSVQSDKDRLGLNSKQYCDDEILHLSADSEVIEDGCPKSYRTSKETRLYLGFAEFLPWPASSI